MSKAVIVIACLLYIISPLDFVPDIPLLGWGDDVVAALIGLRQLVAAKK